MTTNAGAPASFSYNLADLNFHLDFARYEVELLELLVKDQTNGEIANNLGNLYLKKYKRNNIVSYYWFRRAWRTEKHTVRKQEYFYRFLEQLISPCNFTYEKASSELTQLQHLYPTVISLFRGLLNEIHRKEQYDKLIAYYLGKRSFVKHAKPHLDVAIQSYPFQKITYKTVPDTLIIQPSTALTSSGYNFALCTSCSVADFRDLITPLLTSFGLVNSKNRLTTSDKCALVVDVILTPGDKFTPPKVGEGIYIFTKSIEKKDKNYRYLCKIMRLVRAHELLKNGLSVLIAPPSSIVLQDLRIFFNQMINYDICTKITPQTYPWKRYSSRLLFCNCSKKGKYIVERIFTYLCGMITRKISMAWLYEHAVFYGLKINYCTISLQHMFDTPNKYISTNPSTTQKLLQSLLQTHQPASPEVVLE